MKRTYYVMNAQGIDLEVFHSLESARRFCVKVNAAVIQAYATGRGLLYSLTYQGAHRFTRAPDLLNGGNFELKVFRK